MMAWRAAEAVRDLDGVAASIAAGQADVGPRATLSCAHMLAQAWCSCCVCSWQQSKLACFLPG